MGVYCWSGITPARDPNGRPSVRLPTTAKGGVCTVVPLVPFFSAEATFAAHGSYTTNGFPSQQRTQIHEGGCTWVRRPRPLRTTMTAPQLLFFRQLIHLVDRLVGNPNRLHVKLMPSLLTTYLSIFVIRRLLRILPDPTTLNPKINLKPGHKQD